MSTIETRQLRGAARNNVLRAGASILVAILFAACASTTPTASSSPSPSPLVLGRENCNPPSPRVPSPGMEPATVVGTVTEGHSIRALMEPLVYAGDEAKIIWRMTGTGSLVIYAIHQDGTRIEPLQTDPHAGVGDEWGVFFRFTQPGCWRIHAERGFARGDIWFIASVRPS